MSERPTEQSPAQPKAVTLDDLRRRIDAIDVEMHALLIERSSIIDELIAVKQARKKGVAFRPGREADMMRRIVERHHGTLPLVTVEHLWREIISTFTFLQAPYEVHVAGAGKPQAMRDVARFYFGFTVPLHQHDTSADAIAAVVGSRSDLAIVPIDGPKSAWWDALGGEGAPGIIARLPFFQSDDRAGGEPAVLISNPLDDPVEPELLCFAAPADASILSGIEGVEILARKRDDTAPNTLFSVDAAHDLAALTDAIGCEPRPVGGYANTRAIAMEEGVSA